MAGLYTSATYGQAEDKKYEEHDNALLDAQIKLLGQVKDAPNYTVAVRFAEAYALISGKTVRQPVEVKQA